jgi:hypothetical protein
MACSVSSSVVTFPRHDLDVSVFFDDQSDDINGHAVLHLCNDSVERRLFRLESPARLCRFEPKYGSLKPGGTKEINIYFYKLDECTPDQLRCEVTLFDAVDVSVGKCDDLETAWSKVDKESVLASGLRCRFDVLPVPRKPATLVKAKPGEIEKLEKMERVRSLKEEIGEYKKILEKIRMEREAKERREKEKEIVMLNVLMMLSVPLLFALLAVVFKKLLSSQV